MEHHESDSMNLWHPEQNNAIMGAMSMKTDIKPFLSTILSRTSIAEVFHQHGVSLRRSGEDFVACCPFHDERTPSCHLYAKENRYYCFGCGAHGDALMFLMQRDGQSFRDAVISLAGAAGVALPESFLSSGGRGTSAGRGGGGGGFGGWMRPSAGAAPISGAVRQDGSVPRKMREPRAWESPPPPTPEESASCREAVREGARIYQEMISHPVARKAILDRGITAQSIERFALGYADGSSPVLRYARQEGDDSRRMEAFALAGLIARKEPGKAWADRFRHRLIFPIRDADGSFCGMGGRYVAPPESGFGKPSPVRPKYINTPDTPVYHKNQMLYGLYENRAAIEAARHAFLVEGYMDVIGLVQAGVENAVASCGTALTDAQLQLLLRYAPSVTFCFDGDAPGREAALKAAKKSVEYLRDDVRIRVMFLPDGQDPDSLMRSPGGPDLFDKLACDAVSVLDVLMDAIRAGHSLADADGRDAFLREWSYYLERIPGQSVRDGWETVVRSVMDSPPAEPSCHEMRTESSPRAASGDTGISVARSSWANAPGMPKPLPEKVVFRALWWIYHCEGTDLQDLWGTIPAAHLIYEARRSPSSAVLVMVLRSMAEGTPPSGAKTGKVLDILKKVEAQEEFVTIARNMSDAAKRQEISAMVAKLSRQAVRGRVAYVAWMADTYGEGALSDEERSLLKMRMG